MHTEKIIYCSQCKNSQYTDVGGQRRLRCRTFVENECEEFLTVNCTYAIDCENFIPEKAEYKTHKQWLLECWRCGIEVT